MMATISKFILICSLCCTLLHVQLTFQNYTLRAGFTSSYAAESSSGGKSVYKTELENKGQYLTLITLIAIGLVGATILQDYVTLEEGASLPTDALLFVAGAAFFIAGEVMAWMDYEESFHEEIEYDEGELTKHQKDFFKMEKERLEAVRGSAETKVLLQYGAAAAFAGAAVVSYTKDVEVKAEIVETVAEAEVVIEAVVVPDPPAPIKVVVPVPCIISAPPDITGPAETVKSQLFAKGQQYMLDLDLLRGYIERAPTIDEAKAHFATLAKKGGKVGFAKTKWGGEEGNVEVVSAGSTLCKKISALIETKLKPTIYQMSAITHTGDCTDKMQTIAALGNIRQHFTKARSKLISKVKKSIVCHGSGSGDRRKAIDALSFMIPLLNIIASKVYAKENDGSMVLGLGAAGMALLLVFYEKIDEIMEEYIDTPKKRALLFGAIAALAAFSAKMTQDSVDQINENIDKIDGIMSNSKSSSAGIFSDGLIYVYSIPQLFIDDVQAAPLTKARIERRIKNSLGGGKHKFPCMMTLKNGKCGSLTKIIMQRDLRSYGKKLGKSVLRIARAADSIQGKNRLSAKTLDQIDGLKSDLPYLHRRLASARHKRGFDKREKHLQSGLLNFAAGILKKNNTSAYDFLRQWSGGSVGSAPDDGVSAKKAPGMAPQQQSSPSMAPESEYESVADAGMESGRPITGLGPELDEMEQKLENKDDYDFVDVSINKDQDRSIFRIISKRYWMKFSE
jgi:hypothetical protein